MTRHSVPLSKPKKGPPVRPEDVHVYQRRPGEWPTKDVPCAVCERVERWQGHVVPEVSAEVKAVGERIVGEGRTDG